MEKVIIYGTGRHAELVAHEMKRFNLHQVVAFTVEEKYINNSDLNGFPVVPYEEITNLYPPDKFKMFIAVGPQYVNRVREDFFQNAKNKGYSLANCISPSANFPEDLIVGENVYIDAFTSFSSFIEIGDNTTIIGSKIGHHCKIGDNCFISAAILAGNVNLEKNVFIGLGSIIGPNIKLGKHTVIGMGCTISKNTPQASVYLSQATHKQTFDSSRLKLF